MIPSAMIIEGAADSLRKMDPRSRDDQTKELHEAIGEDTATKLGLTFPLSAEVETAYALGVETARRMVAGSAEVILHGADPEKIL